MKYPIFYHYSKRPITAVHEVRQPNTLSYKPSGLWLSVGDSWERYIAHDRPQDFVCKTEIQLADHARLYTFKTLADLDEFHHMFSHDGERINWYYVAQKYQGIFYPEYTAAMHWLYDWSYPIDVSCACIWDPAAVYRISGS